MKLKWLRKIYSDGNHNAFTGLAYFNGRYILAFRNARTHSDAHSRQLIMTSPDGGQWRLLQAQAFPAQPTLELPAGAPVDCRDSYFLNLGHELRLYSFCVTPLLPSGERMTPGSVTTVQITRDGETWTPPRSVCQGAVLWKPIFWQNRFWCSGYRRQASADRSIIVELYQSVDGLTWTRHGVIAGGSESVLTPIAADILRATVRTEKPPYHLEFWESRAPWDNWRKVAEIPRIIQAPHVVNLHDQLYLFARETPDYGPPAHPAQPRIPARRRTKIWRIQGASLQEVLELPSLGDTAYVGTAVRPDGLLLASYYSQHEREKDAPPDMRGGNDKPADVFLAGIETGPDSA